MMLVRGVVVGGKTTSPRTNRHIQQLTHHLQPTPTNHSIYPVAIQAFCADSESEHARFPGTQSTYDHTNPTGVLNIQMQG